MAATLALVFRSRLRLLPLALALAAAAMTFGALSLAGGDLTMASIAALPVLIGLAVDYAIQFQARFDEARRRAASREPAVDRGAWPAGRRSSRRGSPRPSGFLVLLLSPVPMVRGFGLLLVVGHRARARAARCAPASRRSCASAARPARPAAARLGARASRAARAPARARRARVARGPLLADARRGARAPAPRARDRARRGRASGSRSTPRARWSRTCSELVPQDLQALRDVNVLQEETGVSGEIDVTVRADDITDPR